MKIAELYIQMAADVARLRKDMESAKSTVDKTMRGIESAAALARNALVGVAGALSAREYIQAADAVTQLGNRLKLATGSAQAAAAAYESLFDVAQRSRVNFIELGSTYATIARTTQSMGLSQGQLLTVTEAIGNAMTISGGSAESMNAALVQLGQGLASGTLRGEELNSVMEQTPRLAQAIADGLGIPLGALRQYAADGKLSAEAVTSALQSQAGVLKGEVAGATLTVGQAMTQLQNASVRALGEFDRATGLSAATASAMSGLSSAVASVGDAFRTHETAIVTGLGMLAGASTLAGLAAVTTAMGGVAGAIGVVKAAFIGLSAVAAANPVGLALLGIGAAVGGFMAYNSAIADSTEGLERRIYTLQERIKAGPSIYARDADGQREWSTRVREMQAEVAALNRELAAKRGPAMTGSVASGDVALARAQRKEWDAAAGARAEYLAGARTSAQKLADELAKAAKAFGGNIPADVEASIRERFTKPGRAAVSEFDRLKDQLTGSVADGYAQAQAAAQGLNNAQTDFLKLAASPAWAGLSQAQRQQVAALFEIRFASEQAADATKTLEKAQADAAKAYNSNLKTYTDAAQSAQDRVSAMQLEADAIAMAERLQISLAQAVELTTIARLKEKQVAVMGDEAAVLAIQAEIDARQKLVDMLGSKEARQAGDRLRQDEAREWQRTWDQISQSFTDALMEGGKSVAQYLKGLFRTLVLRPILAPIGTGLASLFMPGAASAGQGGSMLSGLGQIGNTISGLGNFLNGSAISSQLSGGFIRAADWLSTSSNSTLAGMGEWMQGNQWLGSAAGMAGNAFAGYGISRGLSGGYSTGLPVNEIAGIASAFMGPIAGVVGGLVNRAFGRKLKDTGIEGTFSGGDSFDGRAFQFYKGGWLRSDKTTYSAMDAGVQDAMGEQYQALTLQSRQFADVLGLSASALDGFTTSVRLSFKGLTDEQVQAKLAETFSAVADRQAELILGTYDAVTKQWNGGPFVREGEKAGEALRRLGGSLALTNTLFDALGRSPFEASLQGADYASSLVDEFGGMDALRQSTMAYFAAFYSDSERIAAGSRQMTKDMEALGLTLPKSRKGFRDLVDAQDLTTEAGRETYAALMGLAPAFAELTAAMEAAGQSVADEIRRLRGLSGSTSAAGLADLQTQFALGTAAARAGDTAALQRLPELTQAIEAATALQAVTSAEVALTRGRLAASLTETLDLLGLDVPAFAVGTNYVPRDMLARIHEGEAIVPRAYNPAAGGAAPGTAEVAQLLRALLAEMQGARSEGRSTAEHTAKTARILDRVARDGNAFVTTTEV